MTDDTPTVVTLDAATGETITRPMTDDEVTELQAARKDAEEAEAARLAAQEAADAARDRALNKLRALGLTAEELAALGIAGT